MEFQKQPSKFIKPLVPTPSNLKHYKIGFIDELAPFVNVNIVLFLSKNLNHDPKFVTQLENSLAKTLTQFYPLAGRYVEESHYVDCNDQGVEFIQASVNIKLENILGPGVNLLFLEEFIRVKCHFSPCGLASFVILIQISNFLNLGPCGLHFVAILVQNSKSFIFYSFKVPFLSLSAGVVWSI
ncbi:putative transferase [Helianthus anomalus]